MVSILRKIGAGILIFFGMAFILIGFAQIPERGLGLDGIMSLIASFVWGIPCLLIAYFLLRKKKDTNIFSEQGTMKNEITKQASQDLTPQSYLSSDARNILDTRYAKGEITKEKYEQMKKNLEK